MSSPIGLDVASLLSSLTSLALATGQFVSVSGHEPASPPAQGVTSAIWLAAIGPAKKVSGLSATAGLVVFTQRIYNPPTTGDMDLIDPMVGNAAAQMIGVFSGAFTLGGSVFMVDLFGSNGTALAAKAGYANHGGTNYRIMDIAIPLVIDGVWTQVP